MLSIKLRPIGKKKQISYRVVVMPKRSKLQGKFVDDLGWYNPHTNLFKIEKERATAWLQKGAQPTDSVHNILVAAGVKEGEKKAVHAKSKKEKAPQENAAPQVEEKKDEAVAQEESAPAEPAQEEQKEEAPPVESAPEEKKEEAPAEEAKPEETASQEKQEEPQETKEEEEKKE